MDELENLDFEIREKKKGLFQKIKDAFLREAESKRGDKFALIRDLAVFSVGFILSRCHLLFGARPVGLAFVSMLPLGVWSALGGVVVGSLSLGEDGIMFAAASCVAVFLRAVCSDRVNGEALFGERLITRMAISVICGFVAAIYGWFVDGFSELTLLFGLSMIILPPVLVFLFSGTFSSGVTLRDLLSSADLFSSARRDELELYNSVFFRISTGTIGSSDRDIRLQTG
jgi:hypothetical protein